MATEEKLLTIKEFAERARVSVGTVQHWVQRKQIAFVRLGERVVRIPESALIPSLVEAGGDGAAAEAEGEADEEATDAGGDGAGGTG